MKTILLTLFIATVALWSYNAGTMYNALEPVKAEAVAPATPHCDEVIRAQNFYTKEWDFVCETKLSDQEAAMALRHTTERLKTFNPQLTVDMEAK